MQILIDAASTGSLYALVALAIGLVFGVMRLINFVQADYVTIGAYALIVPSSATVPTLLIGALPAAFAVLGVSIVVVLLALLTERMVFRPMRNADPTTLLVASFALSVVLQQLVILIYGSRPKSVDFAVGLAKSVEVFDLRIPINQMLTMGTSVTLMLALIVFLKKSPIGIQMRAAADDFTMAQLLGIRANKVILVAFGISGILGAAVAILYVLQTGVLSYRMGLMLVIYGLFSTVIGGMGSLLGAAAGGFLVGASSQILQALLPAELRPFRDAFVFGFVILILLLRPQGLFLPASSKERV